MADFAWALSAPRTGQYDACKIDVPFRFGSIEESYIGTNSKTVIHIQDAHCNYSCQESIRNLLGHLADEYGVDLALLEGGAGNYDLSVFTDIEDRSLRAETADYFVKQGRVNGAENFAINNPEKITLKGLEDKNLYLKNLRKYRETLEYRDEAEKILEDIERELADSKLNIYSDELRDFDQTKNDFNNEKIEIDEYLNHLAKFSDSCNIDLAIHKNLRKLIKVVRQEKNINFKASNAERDELINELSKRLSSRELETFVKKTIQFKQKEIKAQAFYSYLFKKAKTAGVDAERNCPNLSKYRKYIEVYETLNSGNLFSEIETVEEEIFGVLCENEAQKELYTLSKNLTILNKLFNVTLTPQEYKYYKENRHSFSLSFRSLNTYKTKMEEFYSFAFKRDSAFLKNINAGLKNKDQLIVVTGGFHTENLKALLKEKGYSYCSIMPKLDKKDEENPYFRLLNGGLIEEERIVTQAMSSIALGSMFDNMDEVPIGTDEISKQAVRLKVASGGDKVLISDLKFKQDENDNVTCGTVCRLGHEECIGALDDQLEEFYEDLAQKAGIVRNLKMSPLSSEEVLDALIQTGRIKSDTAELLKRIKANLEEIEKKGIQILFAIPKDKTKLWWVKDPKTGEWTYAGGHFNGKGTRIHISIPLMLSQPNPMQVAKTIAMHDYNHITGQGHDENDAGMRIVRKTAGREKEKAYSITNFVSEELQTLITVLDNTDSFSEIENGVKDFLCATFGENVIFYGHLRQSISFFDKTKKGKIKFRIAIPILQRIFDVQYQPKDSVQEHYKFEIKLDKKWVSITESIHELKKLVESAEFIEAEKRVKRDLILRLNVALKSKNESEILKILYQILIDPSEKKLRGLIGVFVSEKTKGETYELTVSTSIYACLIYVCSLLITDKYAYEVPQDIDDSYLELLKCLNATKGIDTVLENGSFFIGEYLYKNRVKIIEEDNSVRKKLLEYLMFRSPKGEDDKILFKSDELADALISPKTEIEKVIGDLIKEGRIIEIQEKVYETDFMNVFYASNICQTVIDNILTQPYEPGEAWQRVFHDLEYLPDLRALDFAYENIFAVNHSREIYGQIFCSATSIMHRVIFNLKNKNVLKSVVQKYYSKIKVYIMNRLQVEWTQDDQSIILSLGQAKIIDDELADAFFKILHDKNDDSMKNRVVKRVLMQTGKLIEGETLLERRIAEFVEINKKDKIVSQDVIEKIRNIPTLLQCLKGLDCNKKDIAEIKKITILLFEEQLTRPMSETEKLLRLLLYELVEIAEGKYKLYLQMGGSFYKTKTWDEFQKFYKFLKELRKNIISKTNGAKLSPKIIASIEAVMKEHGDTKELQSLAPRKTELVLTEDFATQYRRAVDNDSQKELLLKEYPIENVKIDVEVIPSMLGGGGIGRCKKVREGHYKIILIGLSGKAQAYVLFHEYLHIWLEENGFTFNWDVKNADIARYLFNLKNLINDYIIENETCKHFGNYYAETVGDLRDTDLTNQFKFMASGKNADNVSIFMLALTCKACSLLYPELPNSISAKVVGDVFKGEALEKAIFEITRISKDISVTKYKNIIQRIHYLLIDDDVTFEGNVILVNDTAVVEFINKINVLMEEVAKLGKSRQEREEGEGFNDNVTCGTVCRREHEECIGALDKQLEEFYENLAKEAGVTRNFKTSPLTSEEVLTALIQTGRIKSDTAELLRKTKTHIEEKIPGIKGNIQLCFAIPKNNTKLWWVKTPKTGDWTYAGGHFNGKGTRIHISILLILSQPNPMQAAETIAMHDYNHIIGKGHDEYDAGMKLVRDVAEEKRTGFSNKFIDVLTEEGSYDGMKITGPNVEKEVTLKPEKNGKILESIYKIIPRKYYALLMTLPGVNSYIPWGEFVDIMPDVTDEDIVLIYKNNGFLQKRRKLNIYFCMEIFKKLNFSFSQITDFWKTEKENPLKLEKMLRSRGIDVSKLYVKEQVEVDFSKKAVLSQVVYKGKEYTLEEFKTIGSEVLAVEGESAVESIAFKGKYLYRAITDEQWREIQDNEGYLLLRKDMSPNDEETIGPQIRYYMKEKGYSGVVVRVTVQGPYFVKGGSVLKCIAPHFVKPEILVSEIDEPEEWIMADTYVGKVGKKEFSAQQITPSMKATYITETARKMLETLTGENGTERAPLMAKPCTIGMVIKAEPGKDLDAVLNENLANEWNIISRKVDLKIAIERGVKIGDITYIICVDDGTDESLKKFAENLKQAGNPKKQTFAWIVSNENRKENNKHMRELNEAAYVVGLEGEYLSVSWQMLAGTLFADFVYSKTVSDGTSVFQERITAIVESIIKSISMMTKTNFEKLDSKLGEKLRTANLTDIKQLFNGVSLVLNLPDMEPVIHNIEDYQKADKKIQSSL